MAKKWEEEEIKFIRENYKSLTDFEIGQKLGRSASSIKTKRQRLKLEKDKAHRKYSFSDVINEFNRTNYILISTEEDYIDSATNSLKYICPIHKDKGIQTISLGHLQSGRGCFYCGHENSGKTHILSDSFLNKECEHICESKSFIYKGFKRENNKIYIKYICPNHEIAGIQYMTKGNMNRENIIGCPYCVETKKYKFSKGEKKIKQILDELNVTSIRQYSFNNCKDINILPFDFYLPMENKIIEFDGQHHFKPVTFNGISKEEALNNHIITKKHDKIKNDFCKNNNIPLLRIPYFEYNLIEEKILLFLKKEKI